MSPSDASFTIHPVVGTGAPSHRAHVLQVLLEHYADLVDPMRTRDDSSDGAGVLMMPLTWSPSVKELERLIREMRDTHHGPILKWTANGESFSASPRRLWWHLNGYYIQVEHTVYVPPLMPQKNKRRRELVRQQLDDQGATLPQIRVLRNKAVRYPIALKAVEQIAEKWGLGHEPMLPKELVAAA